MIWNIREPSFNLRLKLYNALQQWSPHWPLLCSWEHICLQISSWHLAKLFVLVCQSRDSVLRWGWLIHIYAFVLEPHLAAYIHICSASLHYQCPPTQHSQLRHSLLSLEGRSALSNLKDYCYYNNGLTLIIIIITSHDYWLFTTQTRAPTWQM